jgi:hypothetical protein
MAENQPTDEERMELLRQAAEYASWEMGNRRSPEKIARVVLLTLGPEGVMEMLRAIRGPDGVS